MTFLKPTLMATALILSPAAFAQDAITDKAKDVAVDMAKDKAKSMAADKMGDTGSMATDKAIDVSADMVKGKSMKDAATDAAMTTGKSEAGSMLGDHGKMDGKDAMTAGKVMLKGGSKEDAAMAVAKDKAKDAMMENGKKMLDKGMGQHQGTIKTGAPMMDDGQNVNVSTPTAISAPTIAPINCPYGTTAQPNGTCMITGDYRPRS